MSVPSALKRTRDTRFLTPLMVPHGLPRDFGERRPTTTEVIFEDCDKQGRLAFRELSGIAHGNPTALVREVAAIPEARLVGLLPKKLACP